MLKLTTSRDRVIVFVLKGLLHSFSNPLSLVIIATSPEFNGCQWLPTRIANYLQRDFLCVNKHIEKCYQLGQLE